jgi:hypothetical protein
MSVGVGPRSRTLFAFAAAIALVAAAAASWLASRVSREDRLGVATPVANSMHDSGSTAPLNLVSPTEWEPEARTEQEGRQTESHSESVSEKDHQCGRAPTSPTDLQSTWETRYRHLSATAIAKQAAELEAQLYESTKDEFERRFELGMTETLSQSPVYSGESYDPLAVAWVRIHPGGPVERVVLPPEEFPAAAALRAEIVWLRRQEAHRDP